MQFVGEYHYSGAELNGRKFSIIRNGTELQRVREVLPHGNPIIWDSTMPMRLDVLAILKSEDAALA